MKTWKKYCTSLALSAGLTPAAWAQLPAAPPAAGPAAGVAATPAAPPPATLLSFLGLSKDQLAGCKAKLCATPLGQMLNNSMKPIAALSGGMIGNICPPVIAADLAKPPDSAEGAAARVDADEAAAPAKKAAIRKLATVDCHYWPEAQDALINALRAERNECVRYEAALALNTGCCCTKQVIAKLAIVISGSDEDGNPSETSPRVKEAARTALENCLTRLGAITAPATELKPAPVEIKPREVKPPEQASPPDKSVGAPGKSRVNPAVYNQKLETVPLTQVVGVARRELARTAPVAQGTAVTRKGGDGVINIVAKAMSAPESKKGPTPAPALDPTRLAKPDAIGVAAHQSSSRTVTSTVTISEPNFGRTAGDLPKPTLMDKFRHAATMEYVETGMPAQASVTAHVAEPPLAVATTAVRRVDSPVVVRDIPVPNTAGTTRAAQVSVYPPALGNPGGGTSARSLAQPSIVQGSARATGISSTAAKAPALVPTIQTSSSPAKGADATTKEYLNALHDASDPQQRVWAACQLTTVDWRSSREVVPALLTAARLDSAAMVRVTCVRCLEQMEVKTPEVASTLEFLKADKDSVVRSEVDYALKKLKAVR